MHVKINCYYIPLMYYIMQYLSVIGSSIILGHLKVMGVVVVETNSLLICLFNLCISSWSSLYYSLQYLSVIGSSIILGHLKVMGVVVVETNSLLICLFNLVNLHGDVILLYDHIVNY